MSIEQNKVNVQRYFEEVWNKGNLTVLDEVMLPTVVVHNLPPKLPPNIEGFKQFIKMFRTAFPDLRFTVDDVIAEGDKVVVRWTSTGTHKGQLMNFPPSGKKGTVTGMSIMRFDTKGKSLETWHQFDELGMLQQIGVMPVPA